jgi:hypothetical protein
MVAAVAVTAVMAAAAADALRGGTRDAVRGTSRASALACVPHAATIPNAPLRYSNVLKNIRIAGMAEVCAT